MKENLWKIVMAVIGLVIVLGSIYLQGETLPYVALAIGAAVLTSGVWLPWAWRHAFWWLPWVWVAAFVWAALAGHPWLLVGLFAIGIVGLLGATIWLKRRMAVLRQATEGEQPNGQTPNHVDPGVGE